MDREYGIQFWISVLLLILSHSCAYGTVGFKWPSANGDRVAELRMIRTTEAKYFLYHYNRWRESVEELSNSHDSMNSSTDDTYVDSSSSEREEVFVLPDFKMCYQCVGMLTSRGDRVGCTETIEMLDFEWDEKFETIIPCYGSCMITRKQVNKTVTFVRTCHHEDCVGVPKCQSGNGGCFHCCQGSFCNSNYPPDFLQSGSAAHDRRLYATIVVATLALRIPALLG